jgi:hypothetical protein
MAGNCVLQERAISVVFFVTNFVVVNIAVALLLLLILLITVYF